MIMANYFEMSKDQLRAEKAALEQSYAEFKAKGLKLNMARGKPGPHQMDLAMDLLGRVGVASQASKMPSQLSGGQQQRVAIARAISTRPPIIMADEPTGALDSKTGHEVLQFLQQLNKEGSTVILITHDNGIAATARRCVRLADGKIVDDRQQEVDWL